jgi:hypothetical protein
MYKKDAYQADSELKNEQDFWQKTAFDMDQNPFSAVL